MRKPQPMQPQPKIPLTPGRLAFGLTCLALATCGLLSPVSLIASLWSLRRPEPLGVAALLMSLVMAAAALVGLYVYASPAWIPWLHP